tara:strand:- start:510 stop:716 length:207 start_codon:yes stop_codon:yes gene_type:complete
MEKVSQESMLKEFRERFAKITAETNQLAAKIKENEVTALKLQGAIETLEYYDDSAASPPEEVDEVTAE